MKCSLQYQILGYEWSGCVLGPDNLCTKIGLPIIDVLRDKHPDLQVPDLTLTHPDNIAFNIYEEAMTCPIPLDAPAEVVKSIVTKLQWSNGPYSVDTVLLKNYLTLYKRSSAELRNKALWLRHESPPRANICETMTRKECHWAKNQRGLDLLASKSKE